MSNQDQTTLLAGHEDFNGGLPARNPVLPTAPPRKLEFSGPSSRTGSQNSSGRGPPQAHENLKSHLTFPL